MKESFPRSSDPIDSWSHFESNDAIKDHVRTLLGAFVEEAERREGTTYQQGVIGAEQYLERAGLKDASVSIDRNDHLLVSFRSPADQQILRLTYDPLNRQ